MKPTSAKFIAALALLVIPAVQGFANPQNLTEIVQQCKKEAQISPAELGALKKPYPFPHKIRCYMKCYAEKNGMWADGKPNDTAVINLIKGDYYFHKDSADKLVARYNNCKNLVGNDDCDTVGLIYECLYPQQPPLEPIRD
ncbi:uncharacterized protein LOC135943288 [Cloeon dipterum]|uniref:Uncharacterized protein n=1 Tax=Cloeon dipterum TaxID=197152 RepID=A0A8S1CSU0_9INSE|nr:Hypothetical predicted protein [Cloeon dipterum]